MYNEQWTRASLINYTLIQTPFAALFLVLLLMLQDWMGFPDWMLWSVFFVWVAKDVLLFFYFWPAYEPFGGEGVYSLQDKTGLARTRIDPSGLIWIRSEIWQARLEKGQRPINPGETVQVVQRRGLVLFVRPLEHRAQNAEYSADSG